MSQALTGGTSFCHAGGSPEARPFLPNEEKGIGLCSLAVVC